MSWLLHSRPAGRHRLVRHGPVRHRPTTVRGRTTVASMLKSKCVGTDSGEAESRQNDSQPRSSRRSLNPARPGPKIFHQPTLSISFTLQQDAAQLYLHPLVASVCTPYSGACCQSF